MQIPEYCKSLDEVGIAENAFNLIFAFDEIVALGYRENVNLAQIRTFVEMDSHDERVYQAVRNSQEREAKNKMREKAKELQRQRTEPNKKGGMKNAGFGGGYGSNNSSMSFSSNATSNTSETGNYSSEPIKSTYTPTPKPTSAGPGAMKLGGKVRDVDSFVDQLKEEGENVTTVSSTTRKSSTQNSNAINVINAKY